MTFTLMPNKKMLKLTLLVLLLSTLCSTITLSQKKDSICFSLEEARIIKKDLNLKAACDSTVAVLAIQIQKDAQRVVDMSKKLEKLDKRSGRLRTIAAVLGFVSALELVFLLVLLL